MLHCYAYDKREIQTFECSFLAEMKQFKYILQMAKREEMREEGEAERQTERGREGGERERERESEGSLPYFNLFFPQLGTLIKFCL